MKRIKLNFDELQHNLEVLPYQSLSGIKGGATASDFLTAMMNGSISSLPQGSYSFQDNVFTSYDPTCAWTITLQEVVITAATLDPSALRNPNASFWGHLGGYDPLYGSMHPEIYSGYSYLSGESYQSYADRMSGGPGYGGYNYGGYNPNTQNLIYTAFSWLNSTAGLALSHAECNAYVLKVKLPLGMTRAGIGSSALGVIDNIYEYTQTGNERDAWQAGLAAGVTVIGFIPGGQPVAFVLGVGLFIWEISEDI